MDTILEVSKVCKRYKDFCLENIEFVLPKGYIMGLVGPNGAGKTTIIKAILNAVNIDSGKISVFGLDTKNSEVLIRKRIGYVPDKNCFSESWTANDIALIMKKIYSTWNDRTFKSFLDQYSLPTTKPIKLFSRGMQLKLMLSTIFSRETDLLILDEPTSGLDPVMRNEFLVMIRDYIKDGQSSILYSTHITSDLENTADYITFVNNGRLLLSKTTDTIKESYFIVQGGLEYIDTIKDICIGVRKNEYGFESLVSKEMFYMIPDNCIYRSANIDDIVIFYNLEGA